MTALRIHNSHKISVDNELAHTSEDFIFAMTEEEVFELARRPFQEGEIVVTDGGKVPMMARKIERVP